MLRSSLCTRCDIVLYPFAKSAGLPDQEPLA